MQKPSTWTIKGETAWGQQMILPCKACQNLQETITCRAADATVALQVHNHKSRPWQSGHHCYEWWQSHLWQLGWANNTCCPVGVQAGFLGWDPSNFFSWSSCHSIAVINQRQLNEILFSSSPPLCNARVLLDVFGPNKWCTAYQHQDNRNITLKLVMYCKLSTVWGSHTSLPNIRVHQGSPAGHLLPIPALGCVTEFVRLHNIPYIFLSPDSQLYLSIDKFLAFPDQYWNLSGFIPNASFP